jgi:hypothetical protein
MVVKVPYKLAILLRKLQESGCGPIRQQGGELRCRCPAHEDSGPSLYLALTTDKVLVRCNAGCSTQEVCDRLDHALADLCHESDDEWVEANDGETLLDAAYPNTLALIPETTDSGAAPSSSAIRHEVYADLLGQLELSTSHFDGLRQRGFSPAEISKRGYKTADAGMIRKAVDVLLGKYPRDQLLTVPGLLERNERVVFQASNGFLIPVRDLSGQIAGLKVRHDHGYNGPKYSWASSRAVSCGNIVHVPLGVPTSCETARLTEGELKADVATALSGLPTISAPGVGNWQLAIPVLQALGVRSVLLAMDQDGKPGTLAAVEKALYGLTRAGFDVALDWWDGQAGKGIDDLLAAGQQVEVLSGLVAAVRVRDALTAPGPEEQDATEPEPQPWPPEVFPPSLAAFHREVAEATSTPADFAGLAMLVTAAAAIGNSRAVCLKQNAWYEGPRFYAANVGDPASGKTPAMDVVVKPYQALQFTLLNEYKSKQTAYENAQSEYDKVVKENRTLPEDQRKPLPDLQEEPTPPERFVAVDATVESLAPLLEQNPRGLLMPQDEGVAWVRGMGQYKGGRGNDRQFWLSNWSGKGHMVDRKSQGAVPISIPRPFVNVLCGLPPDMLNELADAQGRNDGFLHRVLFTFPRAVGGTDWTEATVSQESKEAWADTLSRLRTLAMQELDDGVLGYRVVHLSAVAKERWISWWNLHAAEMRGLELPASLVGPWGKLKSYAARIALVLHYLWQVQTNEDEGDIEVASVERAVRLVDYFKSHLRLVYLRLRQTPEDNHLFEVLDWIRRHGSRCTARQLVRAKKVANTEKAKKLLKELAERGYGHLEWLESANNKKVQWFVLEPS